MAGDCSGSPLSLPTVCCRCTTEASAGTGGAAAGAAARAVDECGSSGYLTLPRKSEGLPEETWLGELWEEVNKNHQQNWGRVKKK